MTLDEIITLFQEIETGQEGQLLGFHLHDCIRKTQNLNWRTNASYAPTFSGFLQALKDSPKP
jgi:hypothetical protein